MNFVGIVAAIALAFLLGVAIPKVAFAGAYKCEDRFLDDIDEMQLRAAALRALPKAVHLDEVGPCRNPDSAHARISTKKLVSPEGVQQWYEFTCWRMAQPWKCDPPEFKQSISYGVTVKGVRRQVALSFDRDVSLKRAQAVAQKALEIYEDQSVFLPECESGGSGKPNLVDLRHEPLPQVETATEVRVSHEGLGDAAWLPDVFVEIQFSASAGAADDAGEMCWSEFIVLA